MKYPIVIHKDPKTSYGVTVPDLPGYFSWGDTIDQALENAIEAIECHIEALWIEEEPIPPNQPIDLHIQNSDFIGGTWAVVSIDLSKLSGKTARVNISMPFS